VVKPTNIGQYHEKRRPIDIAQILDYYRISARSISALDLSRVFARFISFGLGQAASKQNLLNVFKEFLLWNHFQGKKMSTEITKPTLGVDYTCILDVQFVCLIHCRMRF
jgi:hypothetical protein